MSPIGMSPRRVTQDYEIGGIPILAEARTFFMFGSGNRDTNAFAKPDLFEPVSYTHLTLPTMRTV